MFQLIDNRFGGKTGPIDISSEWIINCFHFRIIAIIARLDDSSRSALTTRPFERWAHYLSLLTPLLMIALLVESSILASTRLEPTNFNLSDSRRSARRQCRDVCDGCVVSCHVCLVRVVVAHVGLSNGGLRYTDPMRARLISTCKLFAGNCVASAPHQTPLADGCSSHDETRAQSIERAQIKDAKQPNSCLLMIAL